MDIYKDLVLDHYQNPRNFGKLKGPTVSHEEKNSFCGDLIRMEFIVDHDKIKEVAFGGVGCVISMSAASLLTENLIGKNVKEALEMNKEDVSNLLGLDLSPTRLKCAWLSWEVMQKALTKTKKIK